MEAKKHYEILKESDELGELFITTTGDWETDKIEFTRYYNENIKILTEYEDDLKEWEEDD